MKRKTGILAAALGIIGMLAAFAPAGKDTLMPGPDEAGALQVKGTQLCDKEGNPVVLRGISTHGLQWFPQYVNREAFREFRTDWHMNAVRLAMYTAEGGYCEGGAEKQAELEALVDRGIQYAKEADLYVIADWHILADRNPLTHKEEAKAFFARLSGKHRNENHIIYEICNEPNGETTWADIKAYASEVIPVIRANDPDAVILVGTPNWSQYVDQAAADPISGYGNLMYTLHYYAATHREDLRMRAENALKKGLPIFVSEYGICDASGNGGIDRAEAEAWWSFLDGHGISRIQWNLSDKQETSAVLRSGCGKLSGFAVSDLSESGRWLWDMLHR